MSPHVGKRFGIGTGYRGNRSPNFPFFLSYIASRLAVEFLIAMSFCFLCFGFSIRFVQLWIESSASISWEWFFQGKVSLYNNNELTSDKIGWIGTVNFLCLVRESHLLYWERNKDSFFMCSVFLARHVSFSWKDIYASAFGIYWFWLDVTVWLASGACLNKVQKH